MNSVMNRFCRWATVVAVPLFSLGLFGADPTSPASDSETPVANPETDFPFVIRVTTWSGSSASEDFARGDQIKITEVRGNRKRIERGGTYLVKGTYTLASAPIAKLMLSLTIERGSGGRRVARPQFYNIEQGSGTFALAETMADEGDFHVSMYFPDKSGKKGSFIGKGGIHFGNR